MKKIFWIIFFGAFYFLFTIQPVSSQCGWESVTTRYLSDIYIAGSLVSARSDETIYSWDIKLAYPKLFNKDIGGGRIWLSLSPLIEFIANKGTDANPNRGKIAGQINFMLDPTNGRTTVTEIHWLTDIGGEFDRKFDTRNFNVSTFLRLLLRTFGHNRYSFVPEIELGTEFGKNFRNKISDRGSGSFARIYLGFNVYQELGSENLVLFGTYQYRGLLKDEIFSEKIEDEKVWSVTKKARHYFEVGISIPLAKYSSIMLKFKRGSLPPAYSFVNNQFSISFELKAIRAR